MAGIPYKKEELERYWKMYEAAGWNINKLAVDSNEPYSTWQHRLRKCKGIFGKPGERVIVRNGVHESELRSTFDTFKQHGGNLTHAAHALGIARSTLESRLAKIKKVLGLNYYPSTGKILLLDIETAPNRAFVWGMWKQNINPEWIDAAGYILCWTAKWLGEDKSYFERLHGDKHRSLLGPIHKMLGEASAVIHYNGSSFDIPTLNKEFLTHGFTPPSPYKQIDLLLTMRERFRFPSNKLDYICQALSLGEKLRHEGPQLGLDCMEDKPDAWAKMEAYNRRDVELLEKLYHKIMPWISKHPNVAAMEGVQVCVSCGSDNFKRDGVYLAQQLKYERYRCGDCGTWFRGTRTINQKGEQRFALTA